MEIKTFEELMLTDKELNLLHDAKELLYCIYQNSVLELEDDAQQAIKALECVLLKAKRSKEDAI